MIFHVFDLMARGDIPTGSYLFGDSRTNEILWVDPATPDQEAIALIQNQKYILRGIIITHTHYDHVGGVEEICQKWPVPIYIHEKEVGQYGDKAIGVKDGDVFSVGNVDIMVRDVSGHLPHCIAIIAGKKYVFTGDALFAGSVGGTPSQDAFQFQKKGIEEKLFTLCDEYIVCPGHGPISTIGIEKVYNPFFQ